MFDTNNFKRSVKEWMRGNPNGTLEDLGHFCEDLIPPQKFQSHGWLVEQTLGWYEHVLLQRKKDFLEGDDEQE